MQFTDIRIKDDKTAQLAEAHNRASERHQQNRRRRRPAAQGSVRLRNTDSIGRANRIRQRLRSKLSEIMSSSIDGEARKALARNVQMQLDRVELTMRQIRRRNRAQEEEKRERRAEEKNEEERRIDMQREERRRRRKSDMRERSIRVRRSNLYPANQGGLDPYNNHITTSITGPAVSFNVAGQSGTLTDAGAAVDTVDIIM